METLNKPDKEISRIIVKRGFSRVCNATSDEYKEIYFQKVNKDREVCNLMSFVRAIVR